MIYLPHDLTQQNPGTMEYQVDYNGSHYTSGPLPFDEGNGSEGYGTWGILDDASVGGHFQPLVGPGADLRADWSNIDFEDLSTGACCLGDGSCALLTASACAAQNGVYHGDNSVCDSNTCPPVPVRESTWGAIKHSFK